MGWTPSRASNNTANANTTTHMHTRAESCFKNGPAGLHHDQLQKLQVGAWRGSGWYTYLKTLYRIKLFVLQYARTFGSETDQLVRRCPAEQSVEMALRALHIIAALASSRKKRAAHARRILCCVNLANWPLIQRA